MRTLFSSAKVKRSHTQEEADLRTQIAHLLRFTVRISFHRLFIVFNLDGLRQATLCYEEEVSTEGNVIGGCSLF